MTSRFLIQVPTMDAARPLIMGTFLSLLIGQYLCAVIIYYDAKRLELDRPSDYSIGMYVPLGGWIVIRVYLSERKRLASR
jgi:hypothetical protein